MSNSSPSTETRSRPTEPLLLIVGGGPAGLSVARAFRETGGTHRVLIVSADAYAPYERPPLSKDFLRGDSDESDLPLEDPGFYADAAVELQLGASVTDLDLAARTVTLQTGETIGYDRCVLATGASPVRPDLPGLNRPEVVVLRSLLDARELRDRAGQARRAVVVGSGFIGCEAAASLSRRGIAVTLVSKESAPQVARLGSEVGKVLTRWLEEEGVTVLRGRSLSACENDPGACEDISRASEGGATSPVTAVLDDGQRIEADLVVLAAGVRSESSLAAAAGLTVVEGRVRTDQWMCTSDPHVWAVGDVALAFNAAADRVIEVEHWGDALAMGEVAGTVLAGGEASWSQAPGFWSTIGDRTLKYTAWGDGFDTVMWADHRDGGFSAWYARDGVVVGALTHEADDDYDRAAVLIEARAPISAVGVEG